MAVRANRIDPVIAGIVANAKLYEANDGSCEIFVSVPKIQYPK